MRSIAILALALAPALGCAGPIDARVTKAVAKPAIEAAVVRGELGTTIDAYLTNAAALGYSGVVLVASKGEVILHKGYGWADRDRGVPMRADMRFTLSSVDKTFTAAAIMKLRQDGRLALTDKVSTYIPEWPADKAEITIEQLLLHISGMPLDVANDEDAISKQELVVRAAKAKLRSPPGEKWAYSNLGYSLLAVVVETIAKEPLATYLKREIFAPAGMTDTRYRLVGEARGLGYCAYKLYMPECRPDKSLLIADGPTWSLRGNAGLISTTQDLFRWHEALKAGRPLSRESQSLMQTGYRPTTLGGAMGYGLFVSEDAGRGKVAFNMGGDSIVVAKYQRFLDRDLVITQFSNNSRGGAYQNVDNALTKLAIGEPVADLPTETAKPMLANLRRLTGTYVLPSGERFNVELKNGQLFIPLSSPGAARWLSNQPSLSDPALEQVATTQVADVLKGLERADYAPLRASLPKGVDFDGERSFWIKFSADLRPVLGNFQKATVFGSTVAKSVLEPAKSVPQARLIATFDRGVRYIEAQRMEDGWYLNMPSNVPLPPGGYRLVPVTNARFQTYVFANGAKAQLHFTSDGGHAAVRVTTPSEEVIARRQ